jgi:hypothetical protein
LIIGGGELVNRLPEVLTTDPLFIDAFDVENSPLANSQFTSSFFACTGLLTDHHTMQANAHFLPNACKGYKCKPTQPDSSLIAFSSKAGA